MSKKMEKQSKEPTIQEAILLHDFLESLKWKSYGFDPDEVVKSIREQNMSISNLQVGVYNWIIDYTKEHFDYDEQISK